MPAIADLKMLPDLLHIVNEVSSGVVGEARRRGRVARTALVEEDDPVGLRVETLGILVIGSSSLCYGLVSRFKLLGLTSLERTGPP